MEFYMEDTDIFEKSIDKKVLECIKSYASKIVKEHNYKLVISFHVDLLDDPRFEFVNARANGKGEKETIEDKIYNFLNYQLHKIDKLLCNEGIKITEESIQGENLKKLNQIKINLSETTPTYRPKKKSHQFKIRSIVPNLSYTQDTMSVLVSERLSIIYSELMDKMNKEIMCEILEIKKTEDDKKLFQAFAEQYKDLALSTDADQKAAMDRLREKLLFLQEKYRSHQN